MRRLTLVFIVTAAGGAMGWAQPRPPAPLVMTIDAREQAQTMDNFGAAGCWYAEGIGNYWPAEKKARIAELLFSRQLDAQGQPRGIGLSAWRFNIGAGTAEQGDSSGIRDVNRRVEGFLQADGTYDWNKQRGETWFLQQAKNYGVETLIAFSNSPPVQFTRNKLGFKTVKDYQSNLKPDYYQAYASFLAQVLRHYESKGLPFAYISPVNEPQWDWSGQFGQAKQEGSPWTNTEITRVVGTLDQTLAEKQLATQILLPEAAKLTYLYGETSTASRQVQHFFGPNSPLPAANRQRVPRLVAGHSYFTDSGDSAILAVRRHVADTARHYGVKFWQSEYSMLADGYREGTRGRRSAMDCGLFLAKMIYLDVTVAQAAAWQFWNAFEPGRPEADTRYYLIALQPNAGHRDGSFAQTKNLWALGHYSLFIRPGMQRLLVSRQDKAPARTIVQQVMVSAFTDQKGKMVLVAVNYETQERSLKLQFKNFRKNAPYQRYVTTAATDDNLKPYPGGNTRQAISLPPRSITTLVIQ